MIDVIHVLLIRFMIHLHFPIAATGINKGGVSLWCGGPFKCHFGAIMFHTVLWRNLGLKQDRMWYDLTWLCISSKSCRGHGSPFNCQCLHNLSCSFKCYSMYLSNNAWLPAMSFGHRLSMVWAERVGQGEVGWYIHPNMWKEPGCGFGCKTLSRVISPTLSTRKESSYLIGPPCSVQVRLISYNWLALPKQLDHKCA